MADENIKAKNTQQIDRLSNSEIQLGLRTGAKISASNEAFTSNKLIRYSSDITQLKSPKDLTPKEYVDELIQDTNFNITNALVNRIVPGTRINSAYNDGKETLEISLGEAYTPDFSSKFINEVKDENVSYPVAAIRAADESYYYSYGIFTGQTDSKYGKFAAPSSDANAGMGAVISAIKVDKYGSVIGVDYKKISTSDLDNTGGAYDNYRAWVLKVGDVAGYVTGINNAPKEGEKPDATFGNTFELEFAGSGITPTISTNGTSHKVTFTPYLDTNYLTMVGAEGSANAQISHKLQNQTGQPMVDTAKILKATVDAAGHITSVEPINKDDIAQDLQLQTFGPGANESLSEGLVHGLDSSHTDNNTTTNTLFYTSQGKWGSIPFAGVSINNSSNNEDVPIVAGSSNITELKKSSSVTLNPLTGEIKATQFTGNGSQLTNLNAAAITTNVLNQNVIPSIPLSKGGLGRAITANDVNGILVVKEDNNSAPSIESIQIDENRLGSGDNYVLTQSRSHPENIEFKSSNDLINTYITDNKVTKIQATIGTAEGSDILLESNNQAINLHELIVSRQYKIGYIYQATSAFLVKDSDGNKTYDYKIKAGDFIYAIKNYNDAGYPKFNVIQSYYELPEITEGATKTEASNLNGYVKINDIDTLVYQLPEATDDELGGVIVDTSLSIGAQSGHVLATSVVSSELNNLANYTASVETQITDHTSDTSNPHQVTASQVGLGDVVNAPMDNDPTANSINYVKSGGVFSAIASVNSDIEGVSTSLQTHVNNTNNPHQVTKAQVGLGSVENKTMVYPENRTELDNLGDEDIANGNYATAGLVAAYAKDIYGKIIGDQEFNNVVITGSLTVQGDVTSLQTSTLEVEDQLVELDRRDDKTVPLAGYAGLFVDTYDGDTQDSKVVAMAFDSQGIAYVGHAKLDANGLIPVNGQDTHLQPIATRVGFDNLTVNPMVKFNIQQKTLVPAEEGTDYLSSRSILPAENLRGTIQASVVFQGTPIEGDYLANINACTITSGDLSFARVASIAPSTVVGDASTADYGVAEQLSRLDHVHSQYLTEEFEIELTGDVEGSGEIGDPLQTTITTSAVTETKIADGAVTNAKIVTVSAEKILPGTIGSSGNEVDLYGNARTASNLSKPKSTGILYQSNENETSSLAGTLSQVLIEGVDKPEWTNQENITAGNIFGGKTNDILYQTSANHTGFINAPSSPIQNTMTYSGGQIAWVNTNTLHVEEARQAVTVCVSTGASTDMFLMGVRNQNGFQTPESSMIKVQNATIKMGNNSTDGTLQVGASGSHFNTIVIANANAMNNKSNGNGVGDSINLFWPSDDGNIDTVEQRNKKLEEYLPLIGGTLTGSLNIHAAAPQLALTNTTVEGDNKNSKIITNTYNNATFNIVETISDKDTDSIYVGGTGVNGSAPDQLVINTAAQHNSLEKKVALTVNNTSVTLGANINILPGNSNNNLASACLPFKSVYATDYFEGETNINTIYPRAVQDETGASVPTLVAEEDSETPDTVITSVSISEGKLHYTTGILPVDDMVRQNYTNDGDFHPLIMANIVGVSNESGVRSDVQYNNSIYVKASTSELYVQNIKTSGSTPTQLFGNASTATKAAAVYDSEAETSGTRVIAAVSVVEARATASTPDTLVYRDSSGSFYANKIYVEEMESANANGEAHLIGRADIATLADDASFAYALKDSTNENHTRTAQTIITELEDATNLNTGDTIVKRDASGNFQATVVTAALSGNASTATALETARTFYITGGVTADGVSFDGTANVSLNVTAVQPNVIVAGTIGTESAKVNLIGNAKTATTATHLANGYKFSIPIQSSSSNTTFIDWVGENELPSNTEEYLLLATNKDIAPIWVKNRFLHLDGHDTMSGVLNILPSTNQDSYSSYGLNLNNSNIGKVHGIYFNDTFHEETINGEPTQVANVNTVDKGIHFFRDDTHTDTLYAKSGKIYFVPNRTLNSETYVEDELLHSDNYLSYLANTNITDLGSNVLNIENIDINLIGSTNQSTTLLSVPRGGIGVSTITQNAIVIGNGTSAIGEITIGSSFEYLRVNENGDGYEYHPLGTMSEEDSETWTGNEAINSVGTITTGTWNGEDILLDYLDASISEHINDDTLHIPSASTNGKVLISDSSTNRVWTDKILVGDDRVAVNTNLSVNGSINVSGTAHISGDVTLGAGITIAGSTTVVDATTLSTSDLLIEIGKGNTSALTKHAGIFVPNYDGKNAGALVFDNNGTAYIGDVVLDNEGFISKAEKTYDENGKLLTGNDLQPIATRANVLEHNVMMKWDNNAKTLVAAVPTVDYVPPLSGSENVENTYYSTNVNSNGLVTGGSTTLSLEDENVTGTLAAERIIYHYDDTPANIVTVSAALDTMAERLATAAQGITATINVSGDIEGSGNVESGLSLNIVDGAVTTSKVADGAITDVKIYSVSPSKISSGTIGASDNVVNLYGNASTATTANVALQVNMNTIGNTTGYIAVTSSSAGNNNILATDIAVTSSGANKYIKAIAEQADIASAMKLGTPNSTINGGNYFYATDQALKIKNSSTESYIDLNSQQIQVTSSSNKFQIVTNKNITDHAIQNLTLTSEYGTVVGNAAVGLSTVTVNINGLLPQTNSFDSQYVTLATAQNIPAAKSFGSGITLGKTNSQGAITYTNQGCTMKYNDTKKCVQFIFSSTAS